MYEFYTLFLNFVIQDQCETNNIVTEEQAGAEKAFGVVLMNF